MKSCTACQYYPTCTAVCDPVERYISRETRHGREFLFTSSLFDPIQRISSTVILWEIPSAGEVILREHFRNHRTGAEIARIAGVSHQYVTKVVVQARAKLMEYVGAMPKPKRGRPRKDNPVRG